MKLWSPIGTVFCKDSWASGGTALLVMKLWSPIGTLFCKESWASLFCYHLLEKQRILAK